MEQSSITTTGQELFRQFTDGARPSPFELEDGGDCYIKFTAIRLENMGAVDTGIQAVFVWHGEDLCTLRIPGVHIRGGESVLIAGIEGRQRLILAAS